MTNPLLQLKQAGQAVWLDFLDRPLLQDGGLKRLIERDGLTGVTSNPTIFEKAIGESDDYDGALAKLLAERDLGPQDLYERLVVADIQQAADQLRPVYDATHGGDGFVSLEVSPYLARDTQGTIDEARRLWRAVQRPNLMIKVPGTDEGVPAIQALIGEGINVNVTLLFAVSAYLAVAEAHTAGLEAWAARGGDVSRIAGIASFFVSRIDTEIDKAIDRRIAAGDLETQALKRLRGQVAIANAKRAYQDFLRLIAEPRWQALAARGARPQRLLWASTGVKDPAYPELLYAEALIGRDTVDTLPPKTLDAFREQGRVAQTLTQGVDEAERVLAEAGRLGLDLDGVTRFLIDDGVRKFTRSADEVLAAIDRKRVRAKPSTAA